MRYGLPVFPRLRPRPGGDYAAAGRRAMLGDWEATIPVIKELYIQAVAESG